MKYISTASKYINVAKKQNKKNTQTTQIKDANLCVQSAKRALYDVK